MPRRDKPVVEFGAKPEPGVLRMVIDILQGVLGKVVSFADVALLLEQAGFTVTNAATAPGTAIPETRVFVDLEDAGVDSVRLVVRGKNSGVGSVTVQVYDVTHSAALCSVTVTGTTATTYAGDWVRLTPPAGDEELEVRVIGDGVFDPILYAVHLQLRTTQRRV